METRDTAGWKPALRGAEGFAFDATRERRFPRRTFLYQGLLLGLGLGAAGWLPGAEVTDIDIERTTKGRLIPISVSGFSGEVDTVLRFDLTVVGFSLVGADAAQFLVAGSNAGNVQAQVTERINQAVKLAKGYTGGTPRSQAHALADDIVLALTGKPGIARTRIAFKVMQGAGGVGEIFVSDYDGHNAVAVTRDQAIVAAPCWVPGQRTLFYTSYKLNNPDIYSHDLPTGNRKAVARFSGLNTSAAVSPDGRHLAMILSKGGSPNLYVSDLDGQNLRQLTRSRGGESSPCWSPDGQRLCFTSREGGSAWLYTIPVTGGTMTRLRTSGVGTVTEPDWSPDGKTIVFTTTTGGFTLYTVPATGGPVTILVPGEDPSWAPNSRTVIFTRRVGDQYLLSLLDVPTKQVKNIVRFSGSASQPSWAK